MARWMEIVETSSNLGGLPLHCRPANSMIALGNARVALYSGDIEWRQHLKDLAESTISTGHFKKGLDSSQFLSDLCGIFHSFHVGPWFLRTSDASDRAVVSMRSLIQRPR